MATYTKRGPYQWEARVRKKGYPTQSKTFETKSDALAWAAVIESEMVRGVYESRAEAESTTLKEILDRYSEEVTPSKLGAIKEQQKIRQLKKDKLAVQYLATIKRKDIADYKARRLKKVSPSTLNRELNLLSHVFTVAIMDWGIALPTNPVQQIRRPKLNPESSRDRRFEPGEEEALLTACRETGIWLEAAMIMATETALRRGKLLELEWAKLDLKKKVIAISEIDPTSTKKTPLKIPLSSRAIKLLKRLPRSIDGKILQITSADALTMAFRRAREKAGINNFRFHDLRHEATSRLFEKGLNTMQVATITGHKNLNTLKRYTHLKAEDLVKMIG
jgi:integrase